MPRLLTMTDTIFDVSYEDDNDDHNDNGIFTDDNYSTSSTVSVADDGDGDAGDASCDGE